MCGATVVQRWRDRVTRLKTETYALYLAYKDPRTPWYARLFAAIVAGYALSPLDLIPDFVPVLGYLDDLVLVPLGIALALRLMPQPVLEECRENARTVLGQGVPARWTAAAVIIAIWLLLIAVVAAIAVRVIRHPGVPPG